MNSPNFVRWRKPTKREYKTALSDLNYPKKTRFKPECFSKDIDWMLKRRVAIKKAANLVVTTVNGYYRFTSSRKIKEGDELLVWMANERKEKIITHVISDGIDGLVNQLTKLELEKENEEKKNPFDIQFNQQLNTLPNFAQLARAGDNDIDTDTITFEVIKKEKHDVKSCQCISDNGELFDLVSDQNLELCCANCLSSNSTNECAEHSTLDITTPPLAVGTIPKRKRGRLPKRKLGTPTKGKQPKGKESVGTMPKRDKPRGKKRLGREKSKRIEEQLMENTLVSSISTEAASTSSTVQHLTLDKTTSPTSVGAISKDSTPKRGKENKKRRRGRPKKNSEFKQLESAKTNESSETHRDYSGMPNEPCQPETCSLEQVVTNNLQSTNVNESLHRTEADCSNNSEIVILNTFSLPKNSETDDVFDKFENIVNLQSSEDNVQDFVKLNTQSATEYSRTGAAVDCCNNSENVIGSESSEGDKENLEKLDACGVTEDSRSDGVVSKEVFTDNSDIPIKLVLQRKVEDYIWAVTHHHLYIILRNGISDEFNGTEAITNAISLDLGKKDCNIEQNKEMCPAELPAENSNILKELLEKRRNEEIENTDGADLAISEDDKLNQTPVLEPIAVPDENIVIPEMPISEGNIVTPEKPISEENIGKPEMPISEENIGKPEMPISEENIVKPAMPILEENIVISEMPILEANIVIPEMPILEEKIVPQEMSILEQMIQDTTVLQDSDDVIKDTTIDESVTLEIQEPKDKILDQGEDAALEQGHKTKSTKPLRKKKNRSLTICVQNQQKKLKDSSTKSGEFLCELCDTSFPHEAFLLAHYLANPKDSERSSKRKHDSREDEEVPIVKKSKLVKKPKSPCTTSHSCTTSPSGTTSRSSTTSRFSAASTSQQKFKCSKCGKKYINEECLKFCCSDTTSRSGTTFRSGKTSRSSTTPQRKFKCSKCGKKYEKEESLEFCCYG